MEKKQKATKASVEIREEFRRLSGGLEVVDAEQDLRVFIRPSDVQDAKRKDFENCVFANACRRLFDSTFVLFAKSVAYVELVGQNGVRRIERYQVDPEMRRLIEAFDRGEPFSDQAAFVLRKPRPSYTLEGKRLQKQKRRQLVKSAAGRVNK